MIPHSTLSVLRFELHRSLTLSRIGVWLLLVLFPVFIISVMKYYEDAMQTEGFGKQNETSFKVYSDGTDTSIDIELRSGRRVAVIRTPGQPPREILIPSELSQRELEASYRQLIAEFEERGKEVPADQGVDDTVWGFIMGGLIGVTSLLGLLLWATPVVQAELEGRTWIYVAVRPRGRISVLFGKYLTAVVWTATAAWTSATVCVWIAQPDYALRLWSSLVLIMTAAGFGYGALYSLIGVCIQRRAMVIAVAYTLIFEFLISFVPAVINQFTIQFRLRNLFVNLMDWRPVFPEEVGGAFLGSQPSWLHVLLLVTFTLVLLFAASQVIQRTEYVTADEA